MSLSNPELHRYQRQLLVENWDQEKLKSARVLIVGTGGLGGIAATYLAAAGVGHISLCDYDTVELSNLNRQILFNSEDIGKSKVFIARERLSALNPHVNFNNIEKKLTIDNATEIAAGHDLIVDGLDNDEGRLILNKAAFDQKIPYIYGAVNEWQGQFSFFHPPATPCLACILTNNSASFGPVPVFGALPGIVGSFEALMALRYLSLGEKPLAGHFLIINADQMKFETLEIEKNPLCPVCRT